MVGVPVGSAGSIAVGPERRNEKQFLSKILKVENFKQAERKTSAAENPHLIRVQ
jgi:hypothetical protein